MSAIRQIVTVVFLGLMLAGCQEDAGDSGDVATPVPDILAPQKAACEKDGGRWGKVPNRETFTCYRLTTDANKTCASKRDCDGLCLARSRTCAPQVPFFGCHEVLSASGIRQTLCIE